jgi:FHA domain
MAICPTCGHDNTYGALVCAKCHTLLVEVQADQISTTLPNPLPAPEPEPAALRRPVRDATLLSAGSVALYIDRSEQPLVIEIAQQAILGRHTSDASMRPRVDLTPYGGYERGISRMHAVIRRTNDGLVAEDLASSNGSWLNDVKLQPYIPVPVRSGDRLRLGQLEIEIVFRQ